MPLADKYHNMTDIRPFATLQAELAISPTIYRTAISTAYRREERRCVS